MKIGILHHREPGRELGYAENELLRIGQERGHQMEVVNPYNAPLSIGSRPELDALVSRAEINTYADSDAYFRVMDFCEAWGIPIINGRQATLNAQDKFRTHALVSIMGVPTPKTVLYCGYPVLRTIIYDQSDNFPYVIKKPYGGRGEGVFFVHSRDDLEEIADSFTQYEPLILQEYIPLGKNEQGHFRDLRVLVCRNATTEQPECLGGYYRNSTDGSFHTNIHAGGEITKIDVLPEGVSEIVEKSLGIIGADVAGVDVAQSQEGELYLLEINISFTSRREIREIIGVPIEEKMLELAESRVNR